jgi:hypothetical protein
MKKAFPSFVWHKRAGKKLSSKILQAKQSPRGEEKKMNTSKENSAEQFLRKLRDQIRKNFTICLCVILGSLSLFSFVGCFQKKEVKSPLGKWKREATYVNGEFSDERRATLTLKKTTFKFEESNCEMKGAIAYQAQAMVWGVEQSDCQGFPAHQTLYYGYEVDPNDGKLKVFHNNRFNDVVREIYRKVE